VDRPVIAEYVKLAIQASTGSNQQGWHWFFVDDPTTKTTLAKIYRDVRARSIAGDLPADAPSEVQRIRTSGEHLTAHLHEVPVLTVPLYAGRPKGDNQSAYWGSLLPAV
jgi:nitroreductase